MSLDEPTYLSNLHNFGIPFIHVPYYQSNFTILYERIALQSIEPGIRNGHRKPGNETGWRHQRAQCSATTLRARRCWCIELLRHGLDNRVAADHVCGQDDKLPLPYAKKD